MTWTEIIGVIGTLFGIWGFFSSASYKKMHLATEKVRAEEFEKREILRKEMCQKCEERHKELFSVHTKEVDAK